MAPTAIQKSWEQRVVTPDVVLSKIEPGMSIFLGTGVVEPRTLIRHLMASDKHNLRDLELIQLVSLGDAIPIDERYAQKYRLKTFFSGWIAHEAITAGRIDLIPCRFSRIPWLFKSGMISVNAAFIQITPPDESGFCSLGPAVDVARQAIERADLVVGAINSKLPFTLGDTLVHVNEIDYFVTSLEPPIYFPRWPFGEDFDKLAANVASMIDDGACISYSIGPLFEALEKHLQDKKDLGIHSFLMTDAVMELMKSGVVTNRRKEFFHGKTVVSYAQGSPELFQWLNCNPLVEFQGLDVVADPRNMAKNDDFIAIVPARKIDLHGRVALHAGKGNVAAGPGEALEHFAGASLSKRGRTIFALPSRNLKGERNIIPSIGNLANQFCDIESLDLVITEYGVASLRGRTIRERALALIDIAHPDDRSQLVTVAKAANILYQDQIYLTETGYLYPSEIAHCHTFKGGLFVSFRAIKPSDEEGMRRLFYRFSDQAVYYRYFSPIKTMPHRRMQEYVNVDYRRTLSIVGIVEEGGVEKIMAEARYVRSDERPYADVAFTIDEQYQGRGIATYLLSLLTDIARKRGIEGFTADVLADNKPMMRVFEKAPFPMKAVVESGIYELTIPFLPKKAENETR
ncbi:MAG: GNAT family N-acetyltransferase [Deltaproteobacteria bacterium]|nr:GNAT family N-acetyltransferase [Deltaproteobacteria bacterium]